MKLRDHYYKIVNESEAGGAWSQYYYGVFSKIINENNYKHIAEVGIGFGAHAKYILKTTNIDHLLLVDPMQFYENDAFANDISNATPEIPGNNWNELCDHIRDYLSEFSDKYSWQRCPSLEANVPNHSLDCVFVDGDHSYNAVLDDLKFWVNKVRSGGKILGDDYWMDDVKRAVQSFEEFSGLKATFIKKKGTDYPIYCFDMP